MLAAAGAALLVGGAWPLLRPGTVQATRTLEPDQVVRFRVIAAGDSPWDQAVKLDVRDAVLTRLEPVLARVHTRAGALAALRAGLPALRRTVAGVLARQRVSYGARVALTRTWFPARVYGSLVLPAGRYRALLVVLGRGSGHNWWCVLFPSLCFVDLTNAVAVPAVAPAAPPPPLPPAWRPPARRLVVRWGWPRRLRLGGWWRGLGRVF
ncbi:Stage II sporulation protein R [Candidatus Hydrogenisulfobacillus filiaventi]|uniref:Stage II sporulation protein R n=1 Tax=Candidatus Hydrogenisulfobacillus filiaventi TaxID=2707344 RepID=A0A6F8ZEQ1_9FIRM|nr:stage II sporulation protein R [Bacillota bacterium]CAB1128476.1 Stage II sporulation protein R [Candidatus Hydrogenisulfobacillus filiaventi]